MSTGPPPDLTVDAVGLRCPMPVIRVGLAAVELGSGLIEVLADDPTTRTDIPAWCRMRSAELLEQPGEQDDQPLRFLIRIRNQDQNAGDVSAT